MSLLPSPGKTEEVTGTFEPYNSCERRQPGLVSSTSRWERELTGFVCVLVKGELKQSQREWGVESGVGGAPAVTEVSQMRIGRQIMDVALGVSAPTAGGLSALKVRPNTQVLSDRPRHGK